MTNATVTGNTASGAGAGGPAGSGGGGAAGSAGAPGTGGAFNQSTSGAALTHVTVDGNTAVGIGGGLNASGGNFAVGNSIIASNQAAPPKLNCAGMITDEGNNLSLGDASVPAGFSSSDPKLTALGSFGGPTQTQALQAGSPAIHHVPTCVLGSDERGVARPVGSACDSGAYEFAPPSIASPAAAATSTSAGTVTASINPNLSAAHTSVTVRYGTSTTYGSATVAQDIGAGNAPVAFSAAIAGLSPATTYHAQVVATNGDGSSSSGDVTFTTRGPVTASLPSVSASGSGVKLTISCSGGEAGQSCSGTIKLTSHVKSKAGKPIAVTAAKKPAKPKPKPKSASKLVTVGSNSYSVTSGQSATVTVKLNAAGRSLLERFYSVPATLTVSGSASLTKKVAISLTVVHSPITFTWAFGPTTTAQVLTVAKIPSKGSVSVTCHGGGCPFAKRHLTPHGGKVALAPLFKKALAPGAKIQIVISAPNAVAKVATFTIQSGKQPTVVDTCLPPGAKTPTRCAGH